MAVDSGIEGLQRAAVEYLSDLGYDTDWPACLQIPEKDADPIVGHCRQILFYAHATLEHLASGNAHDAVWCALRLMKHAMQAEFHGWRSLAVSGQRLSKNNRVRRRDQIIENSEKLKTRNQKICAKAKELKCARELEDHELPGVIAQTWSKRKGWPKTTHRLRDILREGGVIK